MKGNDTDIRITVAVLSDPHFYVDRAGSQEEPSFLQLKNDGQDFSIRCNPWTQLEELIDSEGLRARLVLCPGDITTRADKVALGAAWGKLNSLGRKLNASLVAAATGNHDVCSRTKNDKCSPQNMLENPTDLFENLKALKPAYPVNFLNAAVDSHRNRVHYFGADYVLCEDDDYRLVVLNSCARHTTDSAEYERGRIAKSTLEWLKRELSEGTGKKANILLCHHHPIQHEELDLGSYDLMKGGELLTRLLEEYGDWVIIHGHKHHGRMVYASGGAKAPVVFAAGSLSAKLGDLSDKLRNQFYLVDIALDTNGGPIKGTVRSWNWYQGLGWKKSLSQRDGIYTGCGFGNKQHPDTLADAIKTNCSQVPMQWPKVIELNPELNYVTPKDFASFEKSLLERHSLEISKGQEGKLEELAESGE